MRGFSVRKDDRYPSVQELKQAFEMAQVDPTIPQPIHVAERSAAASGQDFIPEDAVFDLPVSDDGGRNGTVGVALVLAIGVTVAALLAVM